MGFEPTTCTLATYCSATELLPHVPRQAVQAVQYGDSWTLSVDTGIRTLTTTLEA